MRLRKSKYTFLLNAGGKYLVYNSAKNNFWKVNDNVFEFIKYLDSIEIQNASERELASFLHRLSIINTDEEDRNIADNFKLRFLANSFSKDHLDLTIAPTLKCNLCCPYCFEENKPLFVMDKAICDKIVKFVKKHNFAKKIRITWFGGEPLLCVGKIDYILKELSKTNFPDLEYQEIITNGTLLRGYNLRLFKDYKFNAIQVTFDGSELNHDKKRKTANGSGTYNIILSNLDEFVSLFPSIDIKIRINIDKSNGDDFLYLNDFLTNRYKGKKNLFIYPGVLKSCSTSIKNAPFLCNSEVSALYMRYMSHGYLISYPRYNYFGCGANQLSSYVIGPRGELYKCWQDLGKDDRIVGSIFDDEYSNDNLLNGYLLHGSHMNDSSCMECPIMPICDSNCANDRLDNLFNNANHELCSIYREHDYQLLKDKLVEIYNLIEQNRSHIK